MTGEGLTEAAAALASWAAQPAQVVHTLDETAYAPGGHATPAARSAAVCALLDARGRKSGRSMRAMLNLPSGEIRSSITLSLGAPSAVFAEAAERAAEGWTRFKVKLGGPYDEEVVMGLRDRFPSTVLCVDANEAWSPAVAAQRLAFLERHEVEFVEQPLPRSMRTETADLARRFEIPVLLDESLSTAEDALALIAGDVADGGNVKFAKCGGPYEARRIVKILRDHGWLVMMGCNLETSLGNAAAAAFAGALDFADLDSHELLADDPFTGWVTPGGRIETPEGAGAGVEIRDVTRLRPVTAAGSPPTGNPL